MTGAEDWFVPMADVDGVRLYAFPHAGAGCAQLADFAQAAGEHGVSVWAANLPGRQARLKEIPRTDFTGLTEELAEALADLLDGTPYAVFGYCGGALLAYGVIHRLRTMGAPLPVHLVVASYDAPDITRRPRELSGLPPESFWRYLGESGGVPPALAADPRLRQVAEPALRADFAVLASYRHEVNPPLPTRITVCFGERDEETRRGALLGWRRHTAEPVGLRGLDAGHWLLDDACAELAAAIADSLPGGESR
ncbi:MULTISPECIES: alpha/beta fold hydrolase [Actinosynnema]|uniref:thioesterase II family protein n=1 Tax=Actinosynnema TaxID=40566 RepID=UPI0020A24B80|nr:alpha/beta fold hydrolase [Actinosynnema pretiosum]MCP2097811.1 Surfactin synthase thioesterase subunit [Actinosynnema pretiosum]